MVCASQEKVNNCVMKETSANLVFPGTVSLAARAEALRGEGIRGMNPIGVDHNLRGKLCQIAVS